VGRGDELGIAATKLRPPAPPTRLVERNRLEAILDDGVDRRVPLILASAPAGSGKSTLLSSWGTRHPHRLAWMQVEDADSDPARFWSSLVAAMGRTHPYLADSVAPLVVGSVGDEKLIVPALVNALVDGERLIVVIDDYHLIDNPSVHRGVEQLVDLCPPELTLVLSTRVDPPFRLARLRVRDRVCEIRAHDLRFAIDEATSLLGADSNRLSPTLVDELCTRTEGWAAGLVLAGLSLREASDPARFVEAFRGDDQLVVSYLSDELLATMDADQRRMLLETSVLDRFNGSLVDAVTASSGGRHWLIVTANQNQLVVRLDSTGEWFRYHHLLRDLLVLEAQRAMPERLPELHRRAAEWFESQHDHTYAVQHRLAGDDIPAAMDLMRIVGPDLLGSGQIRTLRALLDQIGETASTDTLCSLLWGWYRYLTGHYVEAQQWLDAALAAASATFDPIIATPLSINVALGRGDVAAALAAAQDVTADVDLSVRPAELATAAGAAYAWAGFADEARSALATAVTRATDQQRLTAHVLALVSLAVVEADAGTASAARFAAERAITTAESYGLPGYHGIAPAFAVRARTETDPVVARADAAHAVVLARRGTTNLGLAYVLTSCGDTLLDHGDRAGEALIVEAGEVIDRCADPGIAGRYMARTRARHHLAAEPADRPAPLVEQLTERELAVLRYLPTQLSQREIAVEMYVSVNTVKTHCRAIYRKLGVSDRKTAVQAARDLRLR
jgi:LuxR family transcriptional regulator, maltose regulon positive regulatory protein